MEFYHVPLQRAVILPFLVAKNCNKSPFILVDQDQVWSSVFGVVTLDRSSLSPFFFVSSIGQAWPLSFQKDYHVPPSAAVILPLLVTKNYKKKPFYVRQSSPHRIDLRSFVFVAIFNVSSVGEAWPFSLKLFPLFLPEERLMVAYH